LTAIPGPPTTRLRSHFTPIEGVEMKQPHVNQQLGRAGEEEYVEFWPAGIATIGRFCCAACGNTVNVRMVLPRCMMCGERLWERAE
jgi:hypothetical protein